MKKWFKVIAVSIIIFLFVLQFIPNRVFIKNADIGGGWLRENKKEVEFVCFGDIYNMSFRPCNVILEITSKRDVNDGFLAKENLEVDSIEIRAGDAQVLNNHIICVPPMSRTSIKVICTGEYGGKGNGVRHPPSSMKVRLYKESER